MLCVCFGGLLVRFGDGARAREWEFDVLESLGWIGLGWVCWGCLAGSSPWMKKGMDGWRGESSFGSGWLGWGWQRACGAGLLSGSLLIIIVQLCRFQRCILSFLVFFLLFFQFIMDNAFRVFLVLVSIWFFRLG